jgi:predicted ATPase
MIESLQLQNFKRFEHAVFPLSRLTVLVGPNGAGKTSVLEALHLTGQLFRENTTNVFKEKMLPRSLIRKRAGVHAMSISVQGTSDGVARSVNLTLRGPNPALTQAERIWLDPNDGAGEATIQLDGAAVMPWTEVRGRPLHQLATNGIWEDLADATILRLDTRTLSAPSPATLQTVVQHDGANLATVLANMKLTDEDRFREICSSLTGIVPQFRSLKIVPALVRQFNTDVAGFSLSFNMDSGQDIAAAHVSEGTLLTVALLTVLHSERRPRLLLLDDIHQALHPRAQMALMEMLQRLVSGPQPVQIIATTHSPYIVDYVEPHAVLVVAQTEEGTSAVRPLSDHPDFERLGKSITAGQLWTMGDESRWLSKVSG